MDKYSVSALTAAADCDLLLEFAKKEKSNLEYQKNAVEHKLEVTEEKYSQIEVDRATIDAQIAALGDVLATMPEGSAKKQMTIQKQKFELRRILMEEQRTASGVISLLEKELALGYIEQQQAELDKFIAAITARKAEIEA